jgi:hypothetical protein
MFAFCGVGEWVVTGAVFISREFVERYGQFQRRSFFIIVLRLPTSRRLWSGNIASTERSVEKLSKSIVARYLHSAVAFITLPVREQGNQHHPWHIPKT